MVLTDADTLLEQDQLERLFKSFSAVKLAYLFGSRVDQSTGPLSDYDFGVYLEKVKAPQKIIAELMHALCGVLGTHNIDLVLMNRAPIELNYAIIAGGEVLFQQNLTEKVEFEARILTLYGDYLPVLREHMQAIIEKDQHEARIQRYREAFRRTRRTLSAIGATQRQKSL